MGASIAEIFLQQTCGLFTCLDFMSFYVIESYWCHLLFVLF